MYFLLCRGLPARARGCDALDTSHSLFSSLASGIEILRTSTGGSRTAPATDNNRQSPCWQDLPREMTFLTPKGQAIWRGEIWIFR